MEDEMLYRYLKYQKAHNLSIWKKFMRLPLIGLIFLAISLGVVVFFIVASIHSEINGFVWIAILIEAITCVILYYYTERYLVDNSDYIVEKNKGYYRDLLNWLEECNFRSDKAILLLLKRINDRMSEVKIEHKEQNNHIEKWIQIIAVPIVLSIITTIITKQEDVSYMITIVTNIVISFVTVCFLFMKFWTLSRIPEKNELKQMKCFADDLQYILDMHTIENINKEEKGKNIQQERVN